MGEGWQLLKIRGIPLRIHPSWFVILGLATVAFQQQYSQQLSGSGTSLELWGLGLLTAVLLFVSVLLHELGHSLVALQQGVQVRSITLFLLGGVASVERECATAMGSLLVAAAGPLVSLLLALAEEQQLRGRQGCSRVFLEFHQLREVRQRFLIVVQNQFVLSFPLVKQVRLAEQ